MGRPANYGSVRGGPCPGIYYREKGVHGGGRGASVIIRESLGQRLSKPGQANCKIEINKGKRI